MQKFIIQGAEDNSPEVQKALENAVYLLKEAGALVRTVNTMNEPIEPAKDFDYEYKKFVPNKRQQEAINDIDVIVLETDDLDVAYIGGGGVKNPPK